MKTLLFSIVLLFVAFFSFAQNDISHYKSILNSSSDNQDKLVAIDSIIKIALREKNYDAFIDYTKSYVELAQLEGKYHEAARKAMNTTYPLTVFTKRPQDALNIINEALTFSHKITDSFYLGGLYLKRGGAYSEIDLDLAVKDYTLAIKNFGVKDTLVKADAYLFRGQCFSSMGKYTDAINDFNAAYDLYESRNETEYMVYARSGEIVVYSQNGIIDKALAEREKLINVLTERKKYDQLCTLYLNQSIDYKKNNNDSLREAALLNAEKYLKQSLDPQLYEVYVSGGFSELYLDQGKYEESYTRLQRAKSYIDKHPEDNVAHVVYLTPLIRYQIYHKDYKNAEENALKRLQLITDYKYYDEFPDNHYFLGQIYENQQKFDKSVWHYKEFARLKDSLQNTKKLNALLYYQTQYETERKEKELIEKASNIKLLEEKNSNLNKQYVLGGSLLTLGFISLLLYRNQRALKAKKELQDKFAQDLLLGQEEERKRMSKDLHDGLGQSLLLIKNKVVLNKDETTKSLVENAIEEVRTISRALHPHQLQELGLTQAIKNTLAQVDETTEIFVTSEIDDIDALFSNQNEIHIFRIVQESLNNIIKHSQATALKIEIKREDSTIKISLVDNGIGFDFSEKYNSFKTLGLKTLKERTRYLQGIMKVTSQTNHGCTLEFIIPIANETA